MILPLIQGFLSNGDIYPTVCNCIIKIQSPLTAHYSHHPVTENSVVNLSSLLRDSGRITRNSGGG